MVFDINNLPYLPDFHRFIDIINESVGNYVSDIPSSEYLDYLLSLGVLVEHNGIYQFGQDWEFLGKDDEEIVRASLQNKFGKAKDLFTIIKFIGSEGKKYEEIIDGFRSQFKEQSIRVVLSWMEELEILRIENGSYFFNDNDPESEEDEETSDSDLNEIEVKEIHFSFFEYHRKVKDGQIVQNPDFQRNKVWKAKQKSQFIESAIMGLPLPPLYFKKDRVSKLIIVDGLQRTTAIQEFMDGDLRLEGLETLHKLNGMTSRDMKESTEYKGYITKLEDYQLFCYILQKSVPMSVIYDIFNRINTGGTKLSRQEIRNCLFIGNSTKLVKRLSENEIFRKAIDDGISQDRMKDREAVLRCLAFQILDYDNAYFGVMDSFLESSMKKLNEMSEKEILEIEKNFLSIMKELTDIFGNRNFRIYETYTRGRINIAVMETVYWCMCEARKQGIEIEKNAWLDGYDKMIKDQSYLFCVRNSTSSKNKVQERFNLAKKYLITG